MTTVALANVTKVFVDGVVAVDEVSLDVKSGEFLVLLGPSGCGKSTILRMIAGLEEPTRGALMLNGTDVGRLAPHERGLNMVFQDYALFPHMSVRENMEFPLRIAGVDPVHRAGRVASLAATLGLGDLLDRRPSELSGGQRQRVAMGRAIAHPPGLLLMDEPLSNLDAGLRAHTRAEITRLVRELGITCVYVTHDQSEALTMADRVAVMRHGVLHDVGAPADVYERPATLYVASFLGQPRMSLLQAEVGVQPGRHVALRLGEQTLFLPWSDEAVRPLSRFHGDHIVVGVRAENMVPVAPHVDGPVLHGRVRHVEHHGHESLAFIDIGASTIVVEDRDPPASPSAEKSNVFRRLVDRVARRQDHTRDHQFFNALPARPPDGRRDFVAAGAVPAGPGRHRVRPADLAVRLQPYPPIRPGQPITVSVPVEALHFFDRGGRRIHSGRRSPTDAGSGSGMSTDTGSEKGAGP